MLSHFLNNHFEEIMALNVFWLISMTVVVIASRLHFLGMARIKFYLNEILYYGVVCGESFLLFLTLFIFLISFGEKDVLDFTLPIYSSTEWVQEDLGIYFIADNNLILINAQGENRKNVFKAEGPIREYHFSPDGKAMIILTDQKLYYYNRQTESSDVIASLSPQAEGKAVSVSQDTEANVEKKKNYMGVINGVKWSAQSDKICYRLARWTKFSSQETWYVYDLKTKKKRTVHSPTIRLGSLTWDKDGKTLYYVWYKALDTSRYSTPYEVKIYKVPLDTLRPELVLQTIFPEIKLPKENLALRDIYLYEDADKLSFGRSGKKHYSRKSEKGSRIGIDAQDHLYYLKNRWWKKRLYKVPRVPVESDMPRHQYRGGRLAIRHFRWLPSGQYVIMEHHFFGILILNPSNGKLGILANEQGNTFGWFQGS